MPRADRQEFNEYQAEYQKRKRSFDRQISDPPPPTVSPKVRSACEKSLWEYGMTVYGDTLEVKPCADHKRLANQIQTAIEQGTKRAVAVQRGFGKTSWCSWAVEWATLTGRAEMAMIISGNQGEADNLASGIVTNLETHDRLFEVFPEIVHFFRETALHGAQLKATFRDELLRLKRRPDIVFPAVPFRGAQACIRCAGIDGKGIRGAHHNRVDGRRVRPTVVLLDDPQDDDLARSSREVDKRESRIKKTIHGLGPPGRTLTVLMPCTPIEKNDLAERFLDHKRTPEYQGIRWPALEAWPDCWEATEGNRWNQYFEFLAEDLAEGKDDHPRATAFYKKNKRAMSKGAKIRWKERIDTHCVDALQSLMNRYAEDRAAFLSEYQMEPVSLDAVSSYLNEREIAGCFNRLKRKQVPEGVTRIVSSIDVQGRILYWLTIGWTDEKRGFILDFGTFPKQPRPNFSHHDAPHTFEAWAKTQVQSGLTWEESLKVSVRATVDFLRDHIAGHTVDLVLIDNRWQQCRAPIAEVSAEPDFADILQTAGGLYVGSGDQAISERRIQRGNAKFGADVEWYFKRDATLPAAQLLFDANHYRSEFQRGLATEKGNPGSITFFGNYPNLTLSEHFGAKQMVVDEGTKRRVEVWKNKIGRDQDHWLDCAVMCRVGLEVLGFRPNGRTEQNAKQAVSRGRRSQRRRITADSVKNWGKK